jgi:putative pyoverdin transport system ATP-binding/permease protein
MNVIIFLLRNSKRIVFLIIMAGIAGGLSSAGLIALIHEALIQPRTNVLMWSYVGLCFLILFSNIASQILLLRLSQGAVYDLRMRLSLQIIRAPLRRIEESGTARLLTALTGDANTISQALSSVPILCINVATLLACLIYISWLSRPLLIGLIIYMALGWLTYHIPMRRALVYVRAARKEMERLFQHFRALVEGNKELKLHRARRADFYEQDLRNSALNMKRQTLKGSSIQIASDSWGRLLYYIFIGLLLFAVPSMTRVRPQDLMGYVLITLYIMGPIGTLLSAVPTYMQAQVALQRLEEVGLSLKDEQIQESHSMETNGEELWHSLELKGVTHAYHNEKEDSTFTLGPIDATFYPGELVFLIGGNGSGKSTLAKILTGLYVPESGKISLDGEDITEETLDGYRQLFTAIFSDFFLFDRLPRPNTKGFELQVKNYLDQLQLNHKVRVDDGVVSILGLSSGQRKRLALLTAYLEDRPFYVFDEWASDQDPTFKNFFYTQILPELKSKGKAILVITHDDRYYHVADRIIKLEDGHSIGD